MLHIQEESIRALVISAVSIHTKFVETYVGAVVINVDASLLVPRGNSTEFAGITRWRN